jgi:hypothetical protein
MERLPISRARYLQPARPESLDVAFLTISQYKHEQEHADTLFLLWEWCGQVYIAEGTSYRFLIILADRATTIEVMADITSTVIEKVRWFMRKHHEVGARRIASNEFESLLAQSHRSIRVGCKPPPLDALPSKDRRIAPPQSPSLNLKRREADLPSGLRAREPRKTRATSPSPACNSVSALWKPSYEEKDMMTLRSGPLSNFIVDAACSAIQTE